MKSILRNILILAAATAIVIFAPIVVSGSVPPFLSIKTAVVRTTDDKVEKAALTTHGTIPKDGSKDAFGYGIITHDSLIVNTTHKGVLDSKTQNGNKDNPVFHNHYAQLVDNNKCPDPKKAVNTNTLTFGSPGKLTLAGSSLTLTSLPKSFEGLTQNGDVKAVVSFKLLPIFTGNHLDAVCVTDITPAEKKFVG